MIMEYDNTHWINEQFKAMGLRLSFQRASGIDREALCDIVHRQPVLVSHHQRLSVRLSDSGCPVAEPQSNDRTAIKQSQKCRSPVSQGDPQRTSSATCSVQPWMVSDPAAAVRCVICDQSATRLERSR